MTTESTQPQTDLGPVQANGQGQSQGHRRRRRRRKNKTSQKGAPQAQRPSRNLRHNLRCRLATAAGSRARQLQTHQRQGRKKKKFFQKGTASAGAARQQHLLRLRRASARASRRARGSLSAPWITAIAPSTATWPMARPPQFRLPGNGHGSHYPDVYMSQPAAPVREDAPTRIFCFIEDLFFQAKIQETARKLGVKVEFVKGDKDSVARLSEFRIPNGRRCLSST